MIEIKNLDFGYKKGEHLFNSLNLKLDKGNIYGLLGKNGAGKSTLLKIMTGLLYANKGEVTFENCKINQRLPKILQEVYFLPEELHLPDFTMDNYIKLMSPFYPKFNTKQMKEIAHEFEITENKSLKTLSYGQKKKFLIAFGISTNCSMILMDEPTNGLDIPSKSQFRKIIASVMDETRSFLISTHQVRDLENLIDPIIIIENGQIIFNHSIEEIASKLDFIKIGKEESTKYSPLFTEDVFGGQHLIVENVNNHPSQVDFELLFNAVLSHNSQIVNHLKK